MQVIANYRYISEKILYLINVKLNNEDYYTSPELIINLVSNVDNESILLLLKIIIVVSITFLKKKYYIEVSNITTHLTAYLLNMVKQF